MGRFLLLCLLLTAAGGCGLIPRSGGHTISCGPAAIARAASELDLWIEPHQASRFILENPSVVGFLGRILVHPGITTSKEMVRCLRRYGFVVTKGSNGKGCYLVLLSMGGWVYHWTVADTPPPRFVQIWSIEYKGPV